MVGCCNDWAAFATAQSWGVAALAGRAGRSCTFSLDGGPGFARESLNLGRVSMPEYRRYCDADADADAAPLYIFDPDILTREFADGTAYRDEYSVPACFGNVKYPI